MPAQKEKTFWEGFGSALTLRPDAHKRLKIYFHGQELSKVKPEESLAQDWKHVGSAIGVILQNYEEEDESRRR
jgi:hypothetical protein